MKKVILLSLTLFFCLSFSSNTKMVRSAEAMSEGLKASTGACVHESNGVTTTVWWNTDTNQAMMGTVDSDGNITQMNIPLPFALSICEGESFQP